MAKGQVAEMGNHKELVAAGRVLKKKTPNLTSSHWTGGVYADMWGQQARGEDVQAEDKGGGLRGRGRGRGGGGGVRGGGFGERGSLDDWLGGRGGRGGGQGGGRGGGRGGGGGGDWD